MHRLRATINRDIPSDHFTLDASRPRPKPREFGNSLDLHKLTPGLDRTRSKNNETDRMDEILKKISQQGRESLSDDELEVLEETSRRMRQDRQEDP